MSDRTPGGLIRHVTGTNAGTIYRSMSEAVSRAYRGTAPQNVATLQAGGTLQNVHGPQLTNAIRAYTGMQRNGGMPFGISVKIDLERLARALNDVDISGRTHDAGIIRALNHTMDKIHTWTKRALTKWAGVNRQKPVQNAMRKLRAYPGNLTAGVEVKDKWAIITAANFSAKFTRGPGGGVSHTAWGRGQFANKAFMLPGKAPAFRHASSPAKHRGDLVPLYGPNYAREMERHAGEVKANLKAFAEIDFIPRATHEVRREFERVKAKYGL